MPLGDQWWRYLTAPFAYVDVGYLFVVAVGLAIFATGVERRLGSGPTALLLLACGALGVLAAGGIASAKGDITVIAGGNGMALGAVAAWFAIRRAESHGAIDEEYDMIGVGGRRRGADRAAALRPDRELLRLPGRRRRRRPRRAGGDDPPPQGIGTAGDA